MTSEQEQIARQRLYACSRESGGGVRGQMARGGLSTATAWRFPGDVIARNATWAYTPHRMSEGILLPPLTRGTLLPPKDRLARLEEGLPQMRAVLSGETDAVALESTLACLLWEVFAQASWCGFYRRVGESMLAVGPYQGTMGCLRIDFARGVCGACARTGEVQLVADVHAFAGHIACDDRTRSELVVPVVAGGTLRAVLDLDSPHVDGFSRAEADTLLTLVRDVFDVGTVSW
jgi:L-methionine (R)-S-oxide reductase